jgi:hypothetical protein
MGAASGRKLFSGYRGKEPAAGGRSHVVLLLADCSG